MSKSHTITGDTERRSMTNRLRRLEGQVRGLQSMIDAGQECEAVLTQVMAVRSALGQVGLHVIGYSMKRCLADETAGDRDTLLGRAFEVFLDYRALAAEGSSARPAAPSTPAGSIERLGDLGAMLTKVRSDLEAGGPCDSLISDIGRATAMINEVALGVLGHAMRECLVEGSDDHEAVVDSAIAVFLKYSACFR